MVQRIGLDPACGSLDPMSVERLARRRTSARRARYRHMCMQCKEIDAKRRKSPTRILSGLTNLIRDLLGKRAALPPDHFKDERA